MQPQWICTRNWCVLCLNLTCRGYNTDTRSLLFFPERVRCWLHPEGADWGERLQHVRVSGVEEQEAADVCGSECPWEASEREENPQEEHGHPLPSYCGVNWRTQLEKEDMQHWTKRFSILKKKRSCRIKTFAEKSLIWKQGTNTVTQKYGHWLWLRSCILFGGKRWYLCFLWHGMRYLSFFFSVPNSLQLEFVCNVDKTGGAVLVNEMW